MIIREVSTQEWLNQELVTSPLYGTIEEVLVYPNQRVSEWEPLFIIKNQNGTLEQISVGLSGILSKLNVNKKDTVYPGKVIAQITADDFI
jgi:biotin carboxyl carrier protein